MECKNCIKLQQELAEVKDFSKIAVLSAKEWKRKYEELKAGLLGEDEVRRVIAHFGQLTSKYPDKQHILAGSNTLISCSQYDDLASALAGKISKPTMSREEVEREAIELLTEWRNALSRRKVVMKPPEENVQWLVKLIRDTSEFLTKEVEKELAEEGNNV